MKPAPITFEHAKEIIYAQPLPGAVKRPAWWLYQHELSKTRPTIYTVEKTLTNVLLWMEEQRLLIEIIKVRPTALQQRLLQMLVDGKSQKQIAFELSKNPRTIHVNFSRLRKRISVDNLYEAVALGVSKKWIKVNKPEKKQ